jgi:eukaryotic-like serine/threonine-protein kinase
VDGDFTGTDRFVIERHLGAGSMGSVYLAYDRQLGSRVALKLLLSVDAAGIYRFKNEFRGLTDVVHPNLVTLHELFSEGEHWFFTMEYVQGKDLLTYLHGGRRRAFESTPKPFSEPPPGFDGDAFDSFEVAVKGLELLFPTPLESEQRLRDTLVQVVEGLLAVHAAGKLHRDLKPENVLVDESGRAVVLDFGIAREKQHDIHATLGSVMGTPAYMAPEQCRGYEINEAADWYALGAILYEALTGNVPIDGTPIQIITRKQEFDPPPPGDLVSGIPDDLNELCVQLLSRDPAARPTGQAILRALRARRAASLPAPNEGGQPVGARAPFVGRTAQLAELKAALDSTHAGRPALALVYGPPGIGKSALIERFISDVVATDGAVVLRGRCYERESVPFKAFDNVIDALSRYLRRLSSVDAARVLPRDVDVLADLFPVLKRVEVVRRNRRPRALPPDPQELRQRAFRALKEMLGRIADVEPLLICIDDLQWSDLDSARLLGELMGGHERPALMLACSFRESEGDPNAALDGFLSLVRGMKDLPVYEVAVQVLSAEDSLTLARALLGSETGDEGAKKLGYEAGGNPQVLTQMVRHVEERRASGKASPETAKALINFERVIEQRLSSLSKDGRVLLELLSVSARPVPESMLTLVASFNISLTSALAELRGKKLVRGVAARDARAVEVYHDTIRESVVASMSPDVLQGWHRRLAAALEASGALDLEALTDHLLGAGDRERASIYAARAAAQAETCLAFDKASRLYGIAAQNNPHPERRRELLHAWANALVEAGHGAEAAAAYVEASRDAPAIEAEELVALAATQLLFAGRLDEGLALLQRALPILGVALPESFRDANLQAAYLWRELRARGLGFNERSEAEVDPAELRRLDLLWGVTRGLLSHELERVQPFITRYVADALELGEPLRIVRGLALFHSHIDAPFSRWAQAPLCGALDVAEALARRIDRPETRAQLAFSRGLCLYNDGRAEIAIAELTSAEDLLRNHCRGCAYELRTARTALAQAQFVVKREANAELIRDWLREATERGDPLGAGRLEHLLAVATLASGDVTAALLHVDNASQGPHASSSISRTTAVMARAAVHLYSGDVRACHESYVALAELWSTAQATVPFFRSILLLLRARLALLLHSSPIKTEDFLVSAEQAVAAVESLAMPCFEDDVRMVRACLAVMHAQPSAAFELLAPLLRAIGDGRSASLASLFAARAHGQLTGGEPGQRSIERAESRIVERGISHPRRFARLFLPGIEDRARASVPAP